jgi:hypothetical protein
MKQGANGRRARGRSGGGGGRKQTPLKMQSFDSSGPDVRVRGHANQVYEKYLSLARDASAAGDRVIAESYFQHAEHYYRIMNESTDPETEPRRESAGEPDGADDGRGDKGGRGTRAERRERHERAERAQRDGEDSAEADGYAAGADGGDAGDGAAGDGVGDDGADGDGRSKRGAKGAPGRNRRGAGAKGGGRGRAHTAATGEQPDLPADESSTFHDDHGPGDADSDSAASA